MDQSPDLNEILKDIPGIVVAIDRNAHIVFSNHLFKYLPEFYDNTSRSLADYPPLCKNKILSFCKDTLKKGEPFICEMRASDLFGAEAYFKCDIAARFDKDGNISHVIASCIDITMQKKELHQMKRSESLLAEALTIAHIGVWDWTLNEPIVHWSDELYDILDLTKTSFIPSYEGYLEKVHPDDRERVRTVMTRVITEHIPFTHEERILRSDGSIRHLQTWGHSISDRSNQLIRIVGVCQDDTERTLLEQRIGSEEHFRKLIFNHIHDPLFSILVESENTFRFQSVNRAFLDSTGLNETQVVGQLVENVIPKPSLNMALKYYHRAINEHRSLSWDEISMYPSGKKYGEVTIIPVFDNQNQCYMLIGTIHDITQRKTEEAKSSKTLALLKESHSVIKATLESTTDGILVINDHEEITGYNQKFIDLWKLCAKKIEKFGYQWALKHVLDQLKNPDHCLQRLKEIHLRPDAEHHDILYFKDGRIFERYSRPQRVGSQIIGRVFSYRDITAQIKAKKALKKSESRLFAFLEKLPLGVLVLNSKNELSYSNQFAKEILSQDLKIGQSVHEIQKNYRAVIAGTNEPYPIDKLPTTRTLHGEASATADDIEIHSGLKPKIIQIWSSPVSNHTGTIEYSIAALQDVTEQRKRQYEISSSLSLLEATLNATADGILVISSHNMITKYNQKFLQILEIPTELVSSLNYRKFIKWMHKQLQSPIEFEFKANQLHTNSHEEGNGTCEFKSGKILEYHSRPQRIDKEIIGRVWSFRDITSQVNAEISLRESEARKTAILTSALDSIITMDHEGRIIEVNPMAEKTFGYISSYAIGKKLSELIIPPHLREAHELGIKRYLDTKEERFLGRRIELPALRADGSIFPAEVSVICISVTNKPIFTGFIRDISERKKNEELIQKGAARMKALVDTTRSFAEARLDLGKILEAIANNVSTHFQDGCIVRLFTEDKTHLNTVAFSHSEPNVRYILAPFLEKAQDYIDQRATQEILKSEKPILVTGDPKNLRYRLSKEYWPLLARFPVHSWIIVPLRVADQILGTITTFRFRSAHFYTLDDTIWLQQIADRASLSINNAQLYSEAQRAIQLREDFMAIASHELKTPLTPLKIQLQLLSHLVKTGVIISGPLGEKLKAVIEDSDHKIQRLTRLVEDILDATRMKTGRLTFHTEDVDLNTLIENVIERLSDSMPGTKCPIEFSPTPIPHGQWDRTRIEQVVLNLITNALKFGEGKPIYVKTFLRDNAVCFLVRDQGIGIAEKDHARVFNRLERAVSYRQFGGLGIGLYISKQIIDYMKGKITVESSLGQGATFTVELPVAQAGFAKAA